MFCGLKGLCWWSEWVSCGGGSGWFGGRLVGRWKGRDFMWDVVYCVCPELCCLVLMKLCGAFVKFCRVSSSLSVYGLCWLEVGSVGSMRGW